MAREALRRTIKRLPGYDPFADTGGARFVKAAAEKAIRFIETCVHHVKGRWAGRTIVLEPWQRAVIANLFGWIRRDGTRRFREALIFLPKKNGKTTLCSAIALYLLFCDDELGAEIYCAAADRDQAGLLWNIAKRQVEMEPEMASRCRVLQHAIVIEKAGSSFKAISAVASTKQGFNSHGVLVDELHAQRDRELVDALITSTAARRQPLVVCLTTADYERVSICNEKYDYACQVRDGIISDPAFLPVIYEAGKKMDWRKPKAWAAANPNMNVSVPQEYLAHECKRAQESPGYENTFKRFHLNIRSEQLNRWLSIKAWDACAGKGAGDPEVWRAAAFARLEGEECIGGLDLGSTSDLTALSFLFTNAAGALIILPWFWIPRDGLAHKDPRHRALFDAWARQGFVSVTDGNVADYDEIRRDINGLADKFGLRELAVDRLFQGAQLCSQLMADGINVRAFGQGMVSMAAPAKEFEELVLGGGIEHGANPVLRWMAANVTVKTDEHGNIKPVKPARNSPLKVDGIVATIMALGRLRAEDAPKVSVYESGGIFSVGGAGGEEEDGGDNEGA